jgi:hypothetical protein
VAGQACNTAGPDTGIDFEGDLPGICGLEPACPGYCGMVNQCGVDAGCYLDAGSPTYLECVQLPDAGSSGTTTGSGTGGTTGSASSSTGSCSPMPGYYCQGCDCQPLGDGATSGTGSSGVGTNGAGTTGSGTTSGGSGSGGCGQPGPSFGPWIIALTVPLLLLRRRRRA